MGDWSPVQKINGKTVGLTYDLKVKNSYKISTMVRISGEILESVILRSTKL